jgi:E3 SUMO-protein ligase PIAS1
MASQSDLPTLTAFIKTLTNPQLKDLLRYESLQVSGVKAALQFRIIHREFPGLYRSLSGIP